MINTLLFLCIIALVAIAYLLYCVHPKSNTYLFKFRKFVLKTLPKNISIIGDKIFGPSFSIYLRKFRDYLFFQNNPIVMIFYVFIITFCYSIYIIKIFIEHESIIPKFDVIFGNSLVFITFYFYYKSLMTPPLFVTPENNLKVVEKYSKYYDGTVFIQNQVCSTCKTIK